MANYNSQTPTQAPSQSGNNTGIIILAVLIIAALAVAAVFYMQNYGSTNSTTEVSRYVSEVKTLPAEAGKAVGNAADNVANTPADAQPVTPEPAPLPTHDAQPATAQ